MRVAIDAMGGDNAPHAVIEAVGELLALKKNNLSLVLVGDKKQLEGKIPESVEIYHTEEVIGMNEHPIDVFKKKKNSSIAVGIQLQKENKVDAFIGAGNTGAYVIFATFVLGRLRNIRRPALATFFPTKKDYTLVLDVGANANSKPSHLCQFAIMGSLYVEKVMNKKNPKIGLLSIGEEDIKGNELTLETFKLLKTSGINFVGNIEGHQILDGKCDVVVCDGTVGNTILKFGESIVEIIKEGVKESIKNSFRAKLGGILLLPYLNSFFSKMDYEEYGGAVLLGTNGATVICHGRSKAKAIKNAVLTVMKFVEKNVNASIEEQISKIM